MFWQSLNPERVKKRNTKDLRKIGIDVPDHLPHLDPLTLRKPGQVARRCVLLAALLQLHFGAPREFIKKYLETNDLTSSLSPNESILLEKDYDDLKKQTQIDVYWFIEAVRALMWVGKKYPNLTFNTGVEDSLAGMLPNFETNESADIFIEGYEMRSEKEILIELDRFYRAHWFARYLDRAGKSSDLVNLDIIMERRKALEWVGQSDLNWDEISLDT